MSEAVDGHRSRQKQGNEMKPAVLQTGRQGGRIKQDKAENHDGEEAEEGDAWIEQLPGPFFKICFLASI